MNSFSKACAITGAVALLVRCVALIYLNRRILERLRLAHHQLWIELGQPGLLAVAFSNRYSPYEFSPGRPTYRGWISDGSYAAIDDETLNSLGDRLRLADASTLVLGGIALFLLIVVPRS